MVGKWWGSGGGFGRNVQIQRGSGFVIMAAFFSCLVWARKPGGEIIIGGVCGRVEASFVGD